jgi:hypothetical protein
VSIKLFKNFAKSLVLLVGTALVLSGCASYTLGHGQRRLPGGYTSVAVPMFNNKSAEVSSETYFTESLRTEFERSKLASVTSRELAQVILEGTIDAINVLPVTTIDSSSNDLSSPNPVINPLAPNDAPKTNPMASGTLLSKEYSVNIGITLVARKMSDNTILWKGTFNSTRNFLAALLGKPDLAASNPIYNQAAKMDTIRQMATDMMSEAHDRLTENF